MSKDKKNVKKEETTNEEKEVKVVEITNKEALKVKEKADEIIGLADEVKEHDFVRQRLLNVAKHMMGTAVKIQKGENKTTRKPRTEKKETKGESDERRKKLKEKLAAGNKKSKKEKEDDDN